MERKTLQKPTLPKPTLSSSGRDALKNKTLPSQQSSTKPNIYNAPKKARKENLLQESTAKVVQLFERTLPAVPHILSSASHRRGYRLPPDESPHPLFKREEFSKLQYMTFMDCPERETLQIMPGWAVEDNLSPASAGEKSSRTPNGEGDVKKPEFKRKIKFGDYAKVGKIVTTQAGTVTAMVHQLPPKPSLAKDARGGIIATKEEIVKATADDNAAAGQEGAAKTGGTESKNKPAPLQTQAKSQLTAVITSEKRSEADSTYPGGLKPTMNDSKLSAPIISISQTPGVNLKLKANSDGTDRAAQHPTSLPKTNPKRPLPDNETLLPAKKAKVSANGPTAKRPLAEDESSSPATKKAKLSNGVQLKDLKESPHLSSSVSQPSHSNGKKEPVLKTALENGGKKPVATKSTPSQQNKPISSTAPKPTGLIPPLLSPTLPPQVSATNGTGGTPTSKSSVGQSSSKAAATKSPKLNPERSGMIDTEAGPSKPRPDIPPLLSPRLPPKVEAAIAARDTLLAALAVSKDAPKDVSSSDKHIDTPKKTVDTVADRHEKSRQPNAPGIARKVVKNGKNRQENSATPIRSVDSSAHTEETSKEQKPSLIVKLKYKKKQRKDIERILKLPPRADAASHDHASNEATNKIAAESSRSKTGDRLSNKDQERPVPTERNAPSKRPAPSSATAQIPSSSTAQKRPRPEEPQQVNNKRLKPSDHPSKPSTPTTPAFKSPAVSAPPSAQKVTTNTPKKSETLRSTAMASVNSTDGNADTPQASQASIPGSGENSVIPARNGDHRGSPGILAVTLKREMDRLHHLKNGGPDAASEADRKLGIAVGLECSLAYMASFDAMDSSLAMRHLPNNGKNWNDLLKLHNHIDRMVRDIPILDVLSLQIKIVSRFRMNTAFASTNFTGVDLGLASMNIIAEEQLWKELGHKMSDQLVQTIEESTSRTRSGFNPAGNFKQFVATSLRKLKRYADTEGVNWDQKLLADY